MSQRGPASQMWHSLSDQHDRIVLWMQRERMVDTHEIEMWVVNNAGNPTKVTGISWVEPDLLVFGGDDGKGTTTFILQHPAQVNVTFNVVKASGQPGRLGFAEAQP